MDTLDINWNDLAYRLLVVYITDVLKRLSMQIIENTTFNIFPVWWCNVSFSNDRNCSEPNRSLNCYRNSVRVYNSILPIYHPNLNVSFHYDGVLVDKLGKYVL